MSDKYKIITVDIDKHNAIPLLEERVNKFIDKNKGWIPNTPPVRLCDYFAQTLIHTSVVEDL